MVKKSSIDIQNDEHDSNINAKRVSLISPTTASGELNTSNNIAFVQADAVYGLIPSNFREFSGTGGSTGVEDKKFKVSTGTTQFGYGAIQSFRALNYKPGESALIRVSGYFPSNVANSWQGLGAGNIGDEVSFGYNGTDFGIWHRYGGISEVRTLTITTPAGGSETLTITLNDVEYTVPVTLTTASGNAREITNWFNNPANQSAWGADQLDDTVIFNALSDGAKNETYSISSTGNLVGSFTQNTAGVTKTSDFVEQGDWNVDTLPDLDPSKINNYQIEFSQSSNIFYYVKNTDSSVYILVHIIKVDNTFTDLPLDNPSLRALVYAYSVGSTTNIDDYATSFAIFLQGYEKRTRNPRAFSNTQSIGSTETVILALRNRRTYNSYINQVEIEPQIVSISSESNKNVIFRVRAIQRPNVVLTYTPQGTNLVGDVATDSTAFSAGRILAAKTVGSGGNAEIDLKDLEVRAPPSLHLIVTGQVTGGGASANLTATINWFEDL